MNKFTFTPTKVALLNLLLIFIQFSCTNDSDLLADYVSLEDKAAIEQQNSTNQQVDTPTDQANPVSNTNETDSGSFKDKIPDMGEIKAFPGAEGFGKNTTGGRGGSVVFVTNLADSGTGSLRWALQQPSPKTIIFRVGGTIELSDYLQINKGEGNVTIAGQTAPGGGIQLKGAELRVRDGNIIIRYMRFRRGFNTNGSPGNMDALRVVAYEGEPYIENVIVDHCSFSWPIDETVYFRQTLNTTFQYNLMSESIKTFITQRSKNLSFINNVQILTGERNLLANTGNHTDFFFEEINNIIYGESWGSAVSYGTRFNWTHNLYTLCEETPPSNNRAVGFNPPNLAENDDKGRIENTIAYVNNNDYSSVYPNEWERNPQDLTPYITDTPFGGSDYVPTATSGLEAKLLNTVGASLPVRDSHDQKMINHYNTRTGDHKFSADYPAIANGIPYPDADNDGMDDNWEIQRGLNPTIADNNGDDDSNGYTNLEEFLHYLTIK